MVLAPSLLYLSRAPFTLSTLVALTYLFFPRFGMWQIDSLRYSSMTISPWDLAISLEMDVGVSMFNPNHINSRLHNATLDIYRVQPTHISGAHQAPTYGTSFGVARTHFHEVPRRDTFYLDSHVSIVRLPFAVLCSFMRELLLNKGVVKMRGVGQAWISAAAQDVTVLVDCFQHVQPFPHPGRIVHTACNFKLANGGGMNGSLLDLLQLQLGTEWGEIRGRKKQQGHKARKSVRAKEEICDATMIRGVIAEVQACEGL
ncbi:hypothetical protein Naga_100003g44 [Nannochloropsis gaditana]|uniref:Uncharacterized protein n=1 Tax=Nannochloropsis gaditana TaxID=72520 RepID=W7UB43_9STRA|nr:hypothetical protein Naga_100003g44 [Nannochloropsis gaditana]